MSRTKIPIKPRASGENLKRILEERVRQIAASDLAGTVATTIFEDVLASSAFLVASVYSHIPLEAQVHVTLYSMLVILVDEFVVPFSDMEPFMERFYLKLPQLHPLLNLLADNIRGMKAFFLPFTTKIIINSTMDFLNIMVFEQESQEMPLHPAALSFVALKRHHSGVADAYFCFAFDKFHFPDITKYIQALP